jgi:hypothetical protein
MTRLFIILIISISLSCCQNKTTNKSKIIGVYDDSLGSKSKSDSFIQLQVILIDKVDTIQLPPYCGSLILDMTLKYKVIKVISGDYNESTILINHICPREAIQNKWVKNDTVYNYKLKRRQIKQLDKTTTMRDYEIVK